MEVEWMFPFIFKFNKTWIVCLQDQFSSQDLSLRAKPMSVLTKHLFIFLRFLCTIIAALPVPDKHSSRSCQSYRFFFEREFHPVGGQAALSIDDKLMALINNVTPGTEPQQHQENWFTGELTKFGTFFTVDNKYLKICETDGSLLLVPKERETTSEAEIASDHSTFSIKDGYLVHKGIPEFTICHHQNEEEWDYYTIHVSQELGSLHHDGNCFAKADGIMIKVFDEHGIQANDFESPEFMYSTGKLLFL